MILSISAFDLIVKLIRLVGAVGAVAYGGEKKLGVPRKTSLFCVVACICVIVGSGFSDCMILCRRGLHRFGFERFVVAGCATICSCCEPGWLTRGVG